MTGTKTTDKKTAPMPRLTCFLKAKHNSVDTITELRKVCLYVHIKDGDGPISSGVNMNLSNLNNEKYDRLLSALGLDRIVEGTPLAMDIYVPEGATLEQWTEATQGDAEKVDNDQDTLDDDGEEEKDG